MSVLSLLVVRVGGARWTRPLVDAGKLRLLMVWTAKRAPNYPDVLTCRIANRTPSDNQAPSASLAKYDMVPNYKSTEDYKRFVTEVIESERKVIDTLGLGKKTNQNPYTEFNLGSLGQ
jgi:hypothetical protein